MFFFPSVQQFCHPNPCYNGGTCRQSTNQKRSLSDGKPWWCECSTGYMGPHCQGNTVKIRNFRFYCESSSPSPLSPPSSQLPLSSPSSSPLLSPPQSQLPLSPPQSPPSSSPLSPPSSSPSLNDQIQLLEMDLCLMRLCQNGGTCLSVKGQTKCLCPPTYRGKYCQG